MTLNECLESAYMGVYCVWALDKLLTIADYPDTACPSTEWRGCGRNGNTRGEREMCSECATSIARDYMLGEEL